MSKEEKVTEKTLREKQWDFLLAEYEKKNPVKFAAKKKAGEFDKIPDSFVYANNIPEHLKHLYPNIPADK